MDVVSLALRYLRTRAIAVVSLLFIALGVTSNIVVNAVMDGFRLRLMSHIRNVQSDLTLNFREYRLYEHFRFAESKLAGESAEAGVLREVKEETGLSGEVVSLVGVYPFEVRNELIIAFHVRTAGEIHLGDELAAVKLIPKDKLKAWPFGTGLAVQAWLERQRG